jgi:hypothetical protein
MDQNKPNSDAPEAVELKSADAKALTDISGQAVDPKNIHDIVPNKPLTPKGTLHLSFRATMIGLAVAVVLILTNVVVIYYVIKSKPKTQPQSTYGVTDLSVEEINKLGGKTATIGQSFGTLVVTPNATFNGTVQINKDTTIGGKLGVVGSTTLAGLTAASTSLADLNVAGNTNLNAATLKSNLSVSGATQMQGGATVGNLLTVGGTLNVIGNASVSGSLTASNISFKSATLNGPITINGHYISGGTGPGISYNTSTLGASGTASVSGNDTTGTIVITPGTGTAGGGGEMVTITFGAGYSRTPRINITPVGREAGLLQYYITRTTNGFKIYTANQVTPPSVGVPSPQIGFDYFIAE